MIRKGYMRTPLMKELALSFESFKVFLSHDDDEGNHVEVTMPQHILTEEVIQATKRTGNVQNNLSNLMTHMQLLKRL